MARLSARQQESILARVRKICLAFPESTERASHGESAFFFREKRSFANTDTYHHGSEHYALWVAAPLGAQDLLVRSDPEHFFRPPYVGHRGWVGVTLDNEPEWDAVERIVADGYAEIATKKRAR
jgi:YjbR protein